MRPFFPRLFCLGVLDSKVPNSLGLIPFRFYDLAVELHVLLAACKTLVRACVELMRYTPCLSAKFSK